MYLQQKQLETLPSKHKQGKSPAQKAKREHPHDDRHKRKDDYPDLLGDPTAEDQLDSGFERY